MVGGGMVGGGQELCLDSCLDAGQGGQARLACRGVLAGVARRGAVGGAGAVAHVVRHALLRGVLEVVERALRDHLC